MIERLGQLEAKNVAIRLNDIVCTVLQAGCGRKARLGGHCFHWTNARECLRGRLLARFKQWQVCLIGCSARDETRGGRDERAPKAMAWLDKAHTANNRSSFFTARRHGGKSAWPARQGSPPPKGQGRASQSLQLLSMPLLAERSRWLWLWAFAGRRQRRAGFNY